MDYKIGDHVFMPRYGIARITDLKQIEAAGYSTDAYVTEFDTPAYMIAPWKNGSTVRSVPVAKAATAFVPLPSSEEFETIFDIAHGKGEGIKIRWHQQRDKFDENLRSGDFIQIAKVYRKAKAGFASNDESSSAQGYLNEAMRTIAIAYAKVFGVNYTTATSAFLAAGKEPEGISEQFTLSASEPVTEITAEAGSPETPLENIDVPSIGKNFTPEIPPPSRSSSIQETPLSVIIRMQFLSDETGKALGNLTRARTIGEVFGLVNKPNWPHVASEGGLDKTRAEAIKFEVNQAQDRLALIVK